MGPEAHSILSEWSPPYIVNAVMAMTLVVYLRGWILLRRTAGDLLGVWRATGFVAGIFFLWVAIGSPLAAFDEASLAVHMVQHILLMLVVPPLVLLGAPALPFLHGLPQWLVRGAVGRVLRRPEVQRFGRLITHPIFCWTAAAVALLAWHVPAAFELALRSDGWHDVEHVCFLLTSLLFWWPVVQPFPSQAVWPRWSIPVYLFLGMLPGSALGAFMTFCDRVLYGSYGAGVFGMTAMEEQIFAGALMWVCGFMACFVPAWVICVRLLSPRAETVAVRLEG